MFILPKVQGLVKLGLVFFFGFFFVCFFCFCFFWQWGEMDFNWKRGRKFSFLMEHMFFFVQSNSGVFCFPDTWNLHAPKVYRGKVAGSNGRYIVLQTLQTRRVPRKISKCPDIWDQFHFQFFFVAFFFTICGDTILDNGGVRFRIRFHEKSRSWIFSDLMK